MKKYRLENHGVKPALFCDRGIVCTFEAGHDQTRHNDALAVLQSMNTDIPALLAALEFYAKEDNWKEQQTGIGSFPSEAECDGGDFARAAIARAKGEA